MKDMNLDTEMVTCTAAVAACAKQWRSVREVKGFLHEVVREAGGTSGTENCTTTPALKFQNHTTRNDIERSKNAY
eukprot:5569399-Amphidinium_carterae.1